MVRELHPWWENLKKRQVKAPKIYIRGSGILHALLQLEDREDLMTHPKVGASWEDFALEQLAGRLEARGGDLCFWMAHAGAEVDLLAVRGSRNDAFEFKRTSSPKVARSMRTAVEDLSLDLLAVVYPGAEVFPLADRIRAAGLSTVVGEL